MSFEKCEGYISPAISTANKPVRDSINSVGSIWNTHMHSITNDGDITCIHILSVVLLSCMKKLRRQQLTITCDRNHKHGRCMKFASSQLK